MKQISFVLIIALCLSMFAGCAQSPTQDTETEPTFETDKIYTLQFTDAGMALTLPMDEIYASAQVAEAVQKAQQEAGHAGQEYVEFVNTVELQIFEYGKYDTSLHVPLSMAGDFETIVNYNVVVQKFPVPPAEYTKVEDKYLIEEYISLNALPYTKRGVQITGLLNYGTQDNMQNTVFILNGRFEMQNLVTPENQHLAQMIFHSDGANIELDYRNILEELGYTDEVLQQYGSLGELLEVSHFKLYPSSKDAMIEGDCEFIREIRPEHRDEPVTVGLRFDSTQTTSFLEKFTQWEENCYAELNIKLTVSGYERSITFYVNCLVTNSM